MKMTRSLLAGLALVLAFTAGGAAQDKPKANPESALKILVVFSEYDGDKKLNSMPYTLSGVSAEERMRSIGASLRMGIKVPVLTQGKDSPQVTYLDVGTFIDCKLVRQEEGRFSLEFTVRRSSVYMPPGVSGKEATFTAGELSGRPVLQEFSGGFTIILRDSETKQGMVATDPLTGHQLKVDVTLNVVK